MPSGSALPAGVYRGRIAKWNDLEGWGSIESEEFASQIWLLHSVAHGFEGRPVTFTPDQQVWFTCQERYQDGYNYAADDVWTDPPSSIDR